MTSEEFYRLRDDRTNRCRGAHRYQRVTCGLRMAPELAATYRGQVLALTAANLMSRWCRRLALAVPDAPLHPLLRVRGCRTLRGRIWVEVHGADPFGDFGFIHGEPWSSSLLLDLGNLQSVGRPANYVVDGAGWLACGGREAASLSAGENDLNPIGPAIAACLGVAQIFKIAIGQGCDLIFQGVRFSAYDFSLGTTPSTGLTVSGHASLGRTLMVGVGSVGSAILYFLRMVSPTGLLVLVDHDTVKLENLNRSPLFGMRDRDAHKAEVGADYLKGAGMTVQAVPRSYRDFLSGHPRLEHPFDLLLPLANEDGVRSAIQHNIPPLMAYGTTTGDWGINFGRHIPGREDCLLCRYPTEPDAKLACGEGPVTRGAEEKQPDAALPFLSALAGVLAVAELIKLQDIPYPVNHNFLYLDLWGPLATVVHFPMSPRSDCACRGQEEVFQKINGDTRYAGLSVDVNSRRFDIRVEGSK